MVGHLADLLKLAPTIHKDDPVEYARQLRPDTKWEVHAIVSTTFYVSILPEFPIGASDFSIPQHIMHNPNIYTLVRDPHKEFNDHLCFFRALALQNKLDDPENTEVQPQCSLEKPTLRLFKEWTEDIVSVSDFSGVLMSELDTLATHFDIDIDVFEFKDNILLPIRCKEYTHHRIMRLLLVNEAHFALIKKISMPCVRHLDVSNVVRPGGSILD